MHKLIKKMREIREFVWMEDIQHSKVPEYIEHHESIQKILNFIDEILFEEGGDS